MGWRWGLFSAAGRPALQDLLGLSAGDEANIGQWMAYLTAWFFVGGGNWRVDFWLAWRSDRPRTVNGGEHSYLFDFYGGLLLCGGGVAVGGISICGSARHGGEWALGVALVVECWPDRWRPILAGVIGAAGNAGYLLIALVIAKFPVTPDHWRWIMLVCTAPALLAFVVVTMLPESQRWKQAVRESAAKPLKEIFTTRLIRPTLLAIGLASVALIGTWGSVQAFLPPWADQMGNSQTPPNPYAKGATLAAVAVGAIFGCLVAPLVARKSAGGRRTLRCARRR